MLALSLDLETTGLNPQKHQIVEIGAVLFDTADHDTPLDELPTFHRYIKLDEIRGQFYALYMMNADLIAKGQAEGVHISTALNDLQSWLWKFVGTSKICLAGKNVLSFDLPFLLFEADRSLPTGRKRMQEHFAYRGLDVGNIYFNPLEDKKIPSLQTCMEIAGIEGQVAHTAVEDAKVVIELLRRKWSKGQ